MKKYLKIAAVILIMFSIQLLYLNYALHKRVTVLEQKQKQVSQKIYAVEVESKKAFHQVSKTKQSLDQKMKKVKQKMNPEKPKFDLMLVAN